MYKVLILEDNQIDADLIQRYLNRNSDNFQYKWISKLDIYKNELPEYDPDIIISDYNLRYYNAYDALEVRDAFDPTIPFIVVSGTIGEEEAVNVIKEGAIDFLIKTNLVRLPQLVMRALEETHEKKERERAEKALRHEVEFSTKLLNSMSGIFYMLDENMNIVRVNNYFLESLGYSIDEVKMKNLNHFLQDEEKDILQKSDFNFGSYMGKTSEFSIRHKDGFFIPFLMTSTTIEQEGNTYILVTAINMTERVEAENKIKEALEEKNILLAEIHHRVKNNLAVVSGIMQLQAFEDEDENVRNKLMSSVSRIKSIALVHEQMYRSESFSSLRFDESLKMLLDSIIQVAEPENVSVEVSLDVDEIELNINQALPCAIIVNEVVTNIYKHAFENRKKGKIEILVKQKDKDIILHFRDDGVGIPKNRLNKEHSSLGFKLIDLLAHQLEGTLKMESDNGTAITLCFPKTNKKGVGSAYLS